MKAASPVLRGAERSNALGLPGQVVRGFAAARTSVAAVYALLVVGKLRGEVVLERFAGEY